jgi:hypothetical protein
MQIATTAPTTAQPIDGSQFHGSSEMIVGISAAAGFLVGILLLIIILYLACCHTCHHQQSNSTGRIITLPTVENRSNAVKIAMKQF